MQILTAEQMDDLCEHFHNTHAYLYELDESKSYDLASDSLFFYYSDSEWYVENCPGHVVVTREEFALAYAAIISAD